MLGGIGTGSPREKLMPQLSPNLEQNRAKCGPHSLRSVQTMHCLGKEHSAGMRIVQ